MSNAVGVELRPPDLIVTGTLHAVTLRMEIRRPQGRVVPIAALAVLAIAAICAALFTAPLRALKELAALVDGSASALLGSPQSDTRRDTVAALPNGGTLASSASSTEPPQNAVLSARSPQQVGASAAVPTSNDDSWVRSCPSSLRLVGSVIDARRPDRSLAAVDIGTGTQIVRPGTMLGSYRLLVLRPRRAYLRAPDNGICELHGVAARSLRGGTPAAPGAPTSDSSSKSTDWTKGIARLDPHTYSVSREMWGRVLSDAKLLRRMARVRVQQAENGAAAGLAITRMSKRSPLLALGLKRGDVLQVVNGHDLATPAGLAAGLNTLRQGGRVSLTVARGGATETLTYIPN